MYEFISLVVVVILVVSFLIGWWLVRTGCLYYKHFPYAPDMQMLGLLAVGCGVVMMVLSVGVFCSMRS